MMKFKVDENEQTIMSQSVFERDSTDAADDAVIRESINNPGTERQQEPLPNREEADNIVEPEEVSYGKLMLQRKRAMKYKTVIKVTSLERVGSVTNRRTNPTLIFYCSTNLPIFRKQHYKNVKKSYNEFKQLSKFLSTSLMETFVPTLPLPYTSYGINNNEDYDKVVFNYQEWFNRVINDPIIMTCEEFAFFIESDFNTYTPISKPKSSKITGLKRKTLKQLAPPYDANIELAEFRPMIKSIYLNLKNIQDKLVKTSKLKRAMVREQNNYGDIFTNTDYDNGNENSLYKRYGKVLITVGDIESIISTMDLATLYDGFEWIINDAYSVKETLTNRHFLMRDLIQAQQNSKQKQENVKKLRSRRDLNPLKIDESLKEFKEIIKYEESLTLKLQRTTENMIIERNSWINWYEKWLLNSIKEYTIRKIEYERKKLAVLERLRYDVRKADNKGGLSRLGRLYDDKDGRIESSQTVQGDSWTGENRVHTVEEVDRFKTTEFDPVLDCNAGKDSTNVQKANVIDEKVAANFLGMSTF
ncbi:hypothetical protein KAFR_0B06400 [Kazachstania africana CBS 2517]|uniref:Vacuolar protein sorting-associated protein 17 n=1 Tax=Kazachstania africana (strain ATCC 22294 / BCRC 22015 / CBS 2517 / CECT 1963 / NBRC 1671 / NRRL Y-8276) TaxID=1071382 RepID=H2ARD6_KAZAF|nr:hypothetical protein KAFR_0B06400 [Kazachstania africana CBS 2517]CCF56936.1 hypothetical protein KAFR_0B06400 [Kazachstania africana CBS 2517]